MPVSIRSIAHFDLDAFYVHVEYLRDSSLRGKPVAVGGHSDRGVVASCSYEARKYGVHSAMSSKLAKRICPELIIVRGDMERYSRFSNLVTDIIRSESPVFEKSSIDEFYIDMTGMDKFFGIMHTVQMLRKKIIDETGLSISHALASNKLISKIATNECKPDGQSVVMPGSEKLFLAPLPIEKLPMVGTRTAATLRNMGLCYISELSLVPIEELIHIFGKHGIDLWRKSQGIDDSPIQPYHEQKSIGTENTFESDTFDIQFLNRELSRMTEKIAFDLRGNNKVTGCITIKIRYSDFQTVTMQSTIPYSSNDFLLLQKAKEIFRRLYNKNLMVRLIGIRFTDIVESHYQMKIFDNKQESGNLYQAIDSVKKKFGERKLIRASGI
jgi:DNA polymerase IV